MKIKAKIGLKDFKFHGLRHESVSQLVEGGLSDQQVARRHQRPQIHADATPLHAPQSRRPG